MSEQEREEMKRRCGGSWKLVLRYLLAGEACCRREQSQAIAGPGHSIAVTSKGQVYTFGHNNSGQLGHGHTDEEARILPVRFTPHLVLQPQEPEDGPDIYRLETITKKKKNFIYLRAYTY